MDRVIWSLEEEEECVAPELQQLAPSQVTERDHRAEDPVEDLGELLRSDPPVGRQPLGEVGEPGDVGEHQ